jgi:hypothetical protein
MHCKLSFANFISKRPSNSRSLALQDLRLPETLEAPKQQLNPLHKQGLIAAPALRGSFVQHKPHLNIDVLQAGNAPARGGLLSPAMAAAAAAGRPGSPGPRSSLVLPSSPMATPHAAGLRLFADPAGAGGDRNRSPVAQQQGASTPTGGAMHQQQQQQPADVTTGVAAAAQSKPGTAAGKQPEQDEYNYIK